MIAAAAALLCGSVYLAVRTSNFLLTVPPVTTRETLYAAVVDGAVLITSVGTAALIGLLVRDWVLRLRIGWVLRGSGRCPRCGYSLIGLLVPASCTVVCPECGMEHAVHVSLAVLGLEGARGASEARAAPQVRAIGHDGLVVQQRPGGWMIERWRRWGRFISVGAVIAIGVGVLAAGTYEVWVRLAVAEARAGRPTAAHVTALIQRYRPDAEIVATPRAETLIREESDRNDALFDAILNRQQEDSALWLNFEHVATPIDPRMAAMPRFDHERHAQLEALARKALDMYNGSGSFDTLAHGLALPRQVRTPTRASADAAIVSAHIPTLDYLSPLTQLSSMLCARARVAIESRDTAVAEQSLKAAIALSRVCCDEPCIIGQIYGEVAAERAFAVAQRWLAAQPDLGELAAIERAWVPRFGEEHVRLAIEVEAVIVTAALADLLADSATVRKSIIAGVRNPFSWGPAAQVEHPGSWSANVAAIEGWRRAQLHRLDMTPVERSADSMLAHWSCPAGAGLANSLLESRHLTRRSAESILDRAATMDAAIAAMIALERWRCHNGAYPETLAQLVPSTVPAIPRNPRTGEALGYLRTDRARERLGRSYLILESQPEADGQEDPDSAFAPFILNGLPPAQRSPEAN